MINKITDCSLCIHGKESCLYRARNKKWFREASEKLRDMPKNIVVDFRCIRFDRGE